MPFYVYILKSDFDGSYYKGCSEDLQRRLIQHNKGECHYTSTKLPWKIIYLEVHPTKREALIRERNLKKATTQRTEALIVSKRNLLIK